MIWGAFQVAYSVLQFGYPCVKEHLSRTVQSEQSLVDTEKDGARDCRQEHQQGQTEGDPVEDQFLVTVVATLCLAGDEAGEGVPETDARDAQAGDGQHVVGHQL